MHIDLYKIKKNDYWNRWHSDKRDDFKFAVINCPHLNGNIPTAPTHGVYISGESHDTLGLVCEENSFIYNINNNKKGEKKKKKKKRIRSIQISIC